MKKNDLLLETINSMVLDMFTIKELKKMGIKPTRFEWKFNSDNINIIPILELYNNNGIYKTFESIEFSDLLQKLLRENQKLFGCTGKIHNSKPIEKLLIRLIHLNEPSEDCSKCGLRDICPIRDD